MTRTIEAANTDQETIKTWFNNMYKTKGFDYLRPQVAYKIFLRHLQAKPEQKLLDVACGLGLMLKTADEHQIKAWGVDLSDEAVNICQKFVPNANTQVANAEALPFEAGQFDLITCLGSLERMIDLPKVLEQLYKVGTKDAKYCFMVRNSNTFIWRFFKRYLGLQNQAGHQDAKTFEQWHEIFSEAGFSVHSVVRDHWPIMRWQRWLSLGLIPIDYTKQPMSPIPLKYATEFVFTLTKVNN